MIGNGTNLYMQIHGTCENRQSFHCFLFTLHTEVSQTIACSFTTFTIETRNDMSQRWGNHFPIYSTIASSAAAAISCVSSKLAASWWFTPIALVCFETLPGTSFDALQRHYHQLRQQRHSQHHSTSSSRINNSITNYSNTILLKFQQQHSTTENLAATSRQQHWSIGRNNSSTTEPAATLWSLMETDSSFFSVSCADLISKWQDTGKCESEQLVRQLLEMAREAPKGRANTLCWRNGFHFVVTKESTTDLVMGTRSLWDTVL
jgi:hypothetical protein